MLTNDSVNLAVVRRLGINGIATANGNFDSIQDLVIYKPDDIVP